MKKILRKTRTFEGYPTYERVLRGVAIRSNYQLDITYRVCQARIPPQTEVRTKAILQTLHNLTLATYWVHRDIEERQPEKRFARFRKKYSSSYKTDGIAAFLKTLYAQRVNGRYSLASHVSEGMWSDLASLLSSWLQKVTEARKKGYFKRYYRSASFIIPFGQHKDKTIGEVGRDRARGYLSLPTREQCEEVINHVTLILDELAGPTLQEESKAYVLPITDYKGEALADLSKATLAKVLILIRRDLNRMEQIEEFKDAVQDFLKWSPPSFPSLHSDGLSIGRIQEISTLHQDALTSFGNDIIAPVTENEYSRFATLQTAAYADVAPPSYIRLQWDRPDAFVRHRGFGIGYDIKNKRYVFLGYILANTSRFKKHLCLEKDSHIVDINNPDSILRPSKQPVQAMLFNLQLGMHQLRILEQARREVPLWKAYEQERQRKIRAKRQAKLQTERGEVLQATDNPSHNDGEHSTSAGAIRSASLEAHYDQERHSWWFGVDIVVGTRQQRRKSPDHVMGVHVDPRYGLTAVICTLRGKMVAAYRLDELTIAELLNNTLPDEEAKKDVNKRTAKEYQHRVADALCILAKQYCAQIGIEDITYRRKMAGWSPADGRNGSESIKTIAMMLVYKLALHELPTPTQVRGVAPKRDCGSCGMRYTNSPIDENEYFICQRCGASEYRRINTAKEIARRTLWIIARTQPPKKSQSDQLNSSVQAL